MWRAGQQQESTLLVSKTSICKRDKVFISGHCNHWRRQELLKWIEKKPRITAEEKPNSIERQQQGISSETWPKCSRLPAETDTPLCISPATNAGLPWPTESKLARCKSRVSWDWTPLNKTHQLSWDLNPCQIKRQIHSVTTSSRNHLI